MAFVAYRQTTNRVILIVSYLFSFKQLKYSNFRTQFFVFYHRLQSMVKHNLYQILNHLHIIFNDEEFFLPE